MYMKVIQYPNGRVEEFSYKYINGEPHIVYYKDWDRFYGAVYKEERFDTIYCPY